MDTVAVNSSSAPARVQPLTPQEAQRRTRQREALALEVLLWRSHLREVGLSIILGSVVVLLAWQWLAQRQVQAFVQLVQVDDGRVHPLGQPMDLLAYTPVDAQWMTMIQDWLLRLRPRNMDPISTKVLWQQAAQYTCGEALRGLSAYEANERPFEPTQKGSTLANISITKVAAGVFQAVWEETVTAAGQVEKQRWTGTFRTGRTRPKRPQDNRLGLCVTWFNWVQQ